MNINRDNYEEFFMLYADNELSVAERKAVETFIDANPDLRGELELFQQFKLAPDASVVFSAREELMKAEDSAETITTSNYESFLVLYADNELTSQQKTILEDFICRHPQLQTAFELMQQVKLAPDANIIFENKQSLYRTEEDHKVIPFAWWKLAVAAMIIIIAGICWLYQTKKTDLPSSVVKNILPVTIPQSSPLHNTEEKKSIDATKKNIQAVKEAVAITDDKKTNSGKENTEIKTPSAKYAAVALVKKGIKQNTDKLLQSQASPVTEEPLATHTGSDLKGSTISSVNKSAGSAEINTGIAAAASKSVIDQHLVYYNTEEDNKAVAQNAVAVDNSNLEVLNTSVNTKNSLRGFFRKASRLISKKANPGDEDGKRKSILIGGFEIAGR